MLVLSRKPGESTVIDGNITITILSVRGDKVRIGITAPSNVKVHRGELHERLQNEADLKELQGDKKSAF